MFFFNSNTRYSGRQINIYNRQLKNFCKFLQKFFKPAQIELPFGHKIASAVRRVRLAEGFSVFRVRAIVDLHKMPARPRLPARELGSADMYYLVTAFAYRDDVFELLDTLLLVVAPLFVRFEPRRRRAAYHTFVARARIRLAANKVPLRGG